MISGRIYLRWYFVCFFTVSRNSFVMQQQSFVWFRRSLKFLRCFSETFSIFARAQSYAKFSFVFVKLLFLYKIHSCYFQLISKCWVYLNFLFSFTCFEPILLISSSLVPTEFNYCSFQVVIMVFEICYIAHSGFSYEFSSTSVFCVGTFWYN